ncbi:MAG: hypothetical protein WAV41_03205 [Microgenomates group bacterium]
MCDVPSEKFLFWYLHCNKPSTKRVMFSAGPNRMARINVCDSCLEALVNSKSIKRIEVVTNYDEPILRSPSLMKKIFG